MVIEASGSGIAAVKILREAILSSLGGNGMSDVAFIGSASSVYEWIPSRIVDFVPSISASARANEQ